MAHECLSEWREIPAGVLQGTKLGPWLFLLMIDDIDVHDFDLWKYVDDTAITECVLKNHTCKIQEAVIDLTTQSPSQYLLPSALQISLLLSLTENQSK